MKGRNCSGLGEPSQNFWGIPHQWPKFKTATNKGQILLVLLDMCKIVILGNNDSQLCKY